MDIAGIDIKELHMKPMPTPPQEVIKFAKDRITKKTHQMKEGFFRAKHLSDWMIQIDKWRGMNLSSYSWLKKYAEDKETKPYTEPLIKEFELNRQDWWSFGYDFLRIIARFSYVPPIEPGGQSYYEKN